MDGSQEGRNVRDVFVCVWWPVGDAMSLWRTCEHTSNYATINYAMFNRNVNMHYIGIFGSPVSGWDKEEEEEEV